MIEPVHLHHLLTMETLNRETIECLLNKADSFLDTCVKPKTILNQWPGKILVNLLYESSTRTRNSFEIAAKRLGAMVISPDMKMSAAVKGESLIDTLRTFEAMGADVFVVRHPDNNIAEFIASELCTDSIVINGGDGSNQHPTQALLDLMTIRHYKKSFSSLKVAIIGDIDHSRVARSLIFGLHIMGVGEIRLIAPKALLPHEVEELPVVVFHSLESGLVDVDVIVTLRIQKERMIETHVPNADNYFQQYGLNDERLAIAKSDAIVMHPGPINRGVELDSKVADGPQSVILDQVTNGVAMRMAVLDLLLSQKK